MTVLISVGRRVPKSWFRRQAKKAAGLISFQEHIWTIIKQSMNMARRKANASNTLTFLLSYDKESEDLNYDIQWIKIVIRGTEAQEKEEYDEAMTFYQPLAKTFKKDIPKDDNMKKHFKSKILSGAKIEEAYKKGYGAISDNNISNKLLEMGILTHIEWVKDFDSRDDVYPEK